MTSDPFDDDRKLPAAPARPEIERMERQDDGEGVHLGQWYWIRMKADWEDEEAGIARGETVTKFFCVTHLASNHAVLTAPRRNGTENCRVRYENFNPPDVVLETNPKAIIEGKIAELRAEGERLMGKVSELMARLGMPNRLTIGHGDDVPSPGTGLMVMSGAGDIGAYKNALIKAKDQELPDLFKEIEKNHALQTTWMTATMLSLTAQMAPMRENKKEIEDRLFSVELYAGLTEQVHRVADGDPAEPDERLHVMQRRLYMDEECLAAYDEGGMDVSDLAEFDEWLARPANRDRLLPFPRTIVAMRIRRNRKEREAFTLGDILGNVFMAEADKKTFLFIRNGDQVWRLACDLEFGELLFGDAEMSSMAGPLMVRTRGGWSSRPLEKLMSVMTFEGLCEDRKTYDRKVAEWKAANPQAGKAEKPYWIYGERVRWHGDDFNPTEWEPLTPDSLEYDAATKAVDEEIASYNRICLIIQGLFDRSPVLHPHPPVKLWSQHGFDAAIKLVHDATRALHGSAEPPDFEEFRRSCNASLAVGSVIAGAEVLWLVREAEKENKRIASSWRRDDRRHTHFRPYGDPGPGIVSTVSDWAPRRRSGTTRWDREKRSSTRFREMVGASLTWSADDVLNVSAYRPGDFKRFYSDPRTREQYLKWAPLLMAAEDWHAGRLKERWQAAGSWERNRR